eukprot:284818181_1
MVSPEASASAASASSAWGASTSAVPAPAAGITGATIVGPIVWPVTPLPRRRGARPVPPVHRPVIVNASYGDVTRFTLGNEATRLYEVAWLGRMYTEVSSDLLHASGILNSGNDVTRNPYLLGGQIPPVPCHRGRRRLNQKQRMRNRSTRMSIRREQRPFLIYIKTAYRRHNLPPPSCGPGLANSHLEVAPLLQHGNQHGGGDLFRGQITERRHATWRRVHVSMKLILPLPLITQWDMISTDHYRPCCILPPPRGPPPGPPRGAPRAEKGVSTRSTLPSILPSRSNEPGIGRRRDTDTKGMVQKSNRKEEVDPASPGIAHQKAISAGIKKEGENPASRVLPLRYLEHPGRLEDLRTPQRRRACRLWCVWRSQSRDQTSRTNLPLTFCQRDSDEMKRKVQTSVRPACKSMRRCAEHELKRKLRIAPCKRQITHLTGRFPMTLPAGGSRSSNKTSIRFTKPQPIMQCKPLGTTNRRTILNYFLLPLEGHGSFAQVMRTEQREVVQNLRVLLSLRSRNVGHSFFLRTARLVCLVVIHMSVWGSMQFYRSTGRSKSHLQYL